MYNEQIDLPGTCVVYIYTVLQEHVLGVQWVDIDLPGTCVVLYCTHICIIVQEHAMGVQRVDRSIWYMCTVHIHYCTGTCSGCTTSR